MEKFKHYINVLYSYKIDDVLLKIFCFLMRNLKLKNTIIIESHNDFDNNGGAFYDYLIDNGYNKKYKIVWLLKNKLDRELPFNVYAYSLYRPSILKNYQIASAKYILTCNNCIGSYRKNQISIFLTHGPFGLKNLKGKCPLPKSISYVLCTSKETAHFSTETYMLENPQKQLLYLGFPIHDILYNDKKGEIKKITSKSFAKVILWMPTFRKTTGYNRVDSVKELPLGIPLFSEMDEIRELNNYLRDLNVLMIIKIHPMQDISKMSLHDMSNIIVLDGITVKKLNVDNYYLMKDADALISDYSSVSYDFLHLDRQIAYTFDDLKEYKLGLKVENPDKYLAGDIIERKEQLYQFINNVINNKDIYRAKRQEVLKMIFSYQDGESCKRLAEFLNL